MTYPVPYWIDAKSVLARAMATSDEAAAAAAAARRASALDLAA